MDVKKPMPPERSGVFWAVPYRTAKSMAKFKAMNLAGLADLERRSLSCGRSIAATVAALVDSGVSGGSVYCHLIVISYGEKNCYRGNQADDRGCSAASLTECER